LFSFVLRSQRCFSECVCASNGAFKHNNLHTTPPRPNPKKPPNHNPKKGGGGPGSSRFRPRPRDALPDDIAALTELKQHTRPVTCMTVDAGSQQLYTGGQDGLVCAWSCASGQVCCGARVLRLIEQREGALWCITGGGW
jgi:WD40 repeat protein